LRKKYQQLEELRARLVSPRAKKRDRHHVVRAIGSIIQGEYGEYLIDYELTEKNAGHFDLEWSLDECAYAWIIDVLFGKRLLVTCRDEWSTVEIIAAYHGQSHIERLFRHFKNPHHHAVRPQYHWTDQKIKVHTFICATGLLLSQLLWKKACEAGYQMSIEKILDRLSEVRQVEILYMSELKGRPRKEIKLEEMDVSLEELYNALVDRVS